MSTTHKYSTLDSLRGIAALMVCSWHYYLINHPVDLFGVNAKPWLFFNAGPEAVILFFILSGFVLSKMLDSMSIRDYKSYIFRRFFRLYPAYYCAILLSILVFVSIKPLPISGLSQWFNDYAMSDLSTVFYIKSMLLIWGVGNSLNNVTWSLTYEMIISIIFPFVYYGFIRINKLCLTDRNGYFYNLIYVLILLIIFQSVFRVHIKDVLYYMHFFIIGSACYVYRINVCKVVNNYYLILGLVLYFFKFITYGYFNNNWIYSELTALGSIIIIINAIYNDWFKKFLLAKIFQFYGKISYSFYLLHLPVVYASIYIGYKVFHVDLLLIKLYSFVIASVLSYLLYNYVELSFIRISKNLIKIK